ncbi:MAG: FtsW/RodA/SpoVE family cell cycle protein [Planctomycetota bacterium]|jgi:rod shape-determining protein RodA
MKTRDYFRYTSWPIVAAMVALMVFGVLAIGAAEQAGSTRPGDTQKQIIYACVGLLAFLAATTIPYRFIGRMSYALFGFVLMLLVLVLFVGKGRDNARRWFDLGPVYLQPAEIAKLSFIIMLAWYLRFGDHYRRLGGLVVPFILTFVPMALIIREPDLGTCLLFLPTLYCMLFMAGAKIRHLLGIVAVATTLVLLPVPWRVPPDASGEDVAARRAVAYGSFTVSEQEYVVMAAPLLAMKPYQLSRVQGWLHQGDEGDLRHLTHQLRQSKMIMGSGGWTGHAEWHQEHRFFRVLPDDHTDFIFAVIGGRWGLVGCVGALLLYAIIFLFGVEIALMTNDPFGRLLAVGVLALLVSQVFINIGMTMGLMPITGMTLPLVSYGGSSMLINGAALGLLVNVGQHRPVSFAPKPFEHGRHVERPHVYDPWTTGRA